MGDPVEKLHEAILGLTISMDALRAELRVEREKKSRRERAKTTKNAARVVQTATPVSALAQAAARRAVRRLGL